MFLVIKFDNLNAEILRKRIKRKTVGGDRGGGKRENPRPFQSSMILLPKKPRIFI